jgi:endonuclease III
LNPVNERLDDIGLSLQDLRLISTKSLNNMIKKKGIRKKRAKEIKKQLRAFKNMYEHQLVFYRQAIYFN